MKKHPFFGVVVATAILSPLMLLGIFSIGKGWPFPKIFPENWSLQNWSDAFTASSGLGQSLGLSLGIGACVAFLATISGFFSARSLAKSSRKNTWLMLAYLPYVLSPVMYAACLQVSFLFLGISGKITGVMLGHFLLAYPFAVILFTGFWNARMEAMAQLAATLGANPVSSYLKVLFPVAKGVLFVCFFQTFLLSWFEYGLTVLIGVGKVPTLTVKVYQYVTEANIHLAALAGCLLVLPPTLMLWINKRYLFTRITL